MACNAGYTLPQSLGGLPEASEFTWMWLHYIPRISQGSKAAYVECSLSHTHLNPPPPPPLPLAWAWILHLPTRRTCFTRSTSTPVLCPLWGCCWGCRHTSHTPRMDARHCTLSLALYGSMNMWGWCFLMLAAQKLPSQILWHASSPGRQMVVCFCVPALLVILTNPILLLFFLVPCCSHFLFYIFIGKYREIYHFKPVLGTEFTGIKYIHIICNRHHHPSLQKPICTH